METNKTINKTTMENSLNRTMQYGNYSSDDRSHTLEIWFKSYYVVWKQTWRKNKC